MIFIQKIYKNVINIILCLQKLTLRASALVSLLFKRFFAIFKDIIQKNVRKIAKICGNFRKITKILRIYDFYIIFY